MSYIQDDDASQIRKLKDEQEKLQALFLDSQFSVQQENIDSGQSTFPGANPISRGGSSGSGGSTDRTVTDLGLKGNTNPAAPEVIDLNISGSRKFKIKLNGHIRFTVSNPSAALVLDDVFVEIIQDGTGNWTIDWPTEFLAPLPFLSADPNTLSVIVFYTLDNGTTYIGYTASTSSGSGSINLSGWSNFPAISTIDADNHDMIGVTGIDMDGVAATIQGVVNLDFLQANQSINSLSGEVDYQGAALDKHRFILGGVEAARIEESTAGVYRFDLLNHTIKDAKDIRFDSGATIAIPGTSPGIGYDTTSKILQVNVPTAGEIRIAENAINGTTVLKGDSIGSNIVNANDVLQLGVDVTVPTVPGEFRNDGTDVTVWSGGAQRNLSNVGVVAGGADVNLSNLTAVSINDHLIPQAGKTLGDASNYWSKLFSNKLDIGTAGTFASGDNAIIADSVEGMEFHTPANDAFRYMFGTSLTIPSWTISKTTLIGSDSASGIQLENHLTLFDTAVDNLDPTVNGQFRNVGGRVKVRTNGVVKDLTDIGAGTFLPLAGGTMTGDIISNGLNNLGTTANPWNNIVSDNTLFCSNLKAFDTDTNINVFNDLDMQAGDTIDFADIATVAGSGSGGTLPANVEDYIIIKVNGVSRRIAFYPA